MNFSGLSNGPSVIAAVVVAGMSVFPAWLLVRAP